MFDVARDDEYVAPLKRYHRSIAHLEAKAALPTQEQLVLRVLMPWERAFEAYEAQHRVIDGCEVLGLPGLT